MTELLLDIEAWIQEGPADIRIPTVNSSCDVGIGSFNESECVSTCEEPVVTTDVVTTDVEDTNPPESSVPVAAIGGAVGAVVVLIILVVVILVVVAVCRHKDGKPKDKQ